MSHPAHKTERVIRTQTVRFYCFVFTGNDPRKGWRIPLNEIKYNEQRDEETGYGYFGARYMDHELMTGWLSVDPMADKYPSISPYAYCAWNPVKLVDPDGNDWYRADDGSIKYTTQYNSSMGENLGKTYNDGRYYYSLFGDKIRNKVKNEEGEWVINPQKEITKNIDNAMMSYAQYAKEKDEFDHAKKTIYTMQNEPEHLKNRFYHINSF